MSPSTLTRHRLTPVQKRVLAFMFGSELAVVFETGHKRTEFVNGYIVRCQSLVWYFLNRHGYICEPNGDGRSAPGAESTRRWELTAKGLVAIGGCDKSPTQTHYVGDSGVCTFCKRKVARNMDRS